MIPIANHLWQSTLFAALAGLLALALRKNRAQVRYWLWLAASVKFLVPFSLLVSAGSQLAPTSKPVDLPAPVTLAMEQVSQTFAPLQSPEIPRPSQTYWPIVLWSIGFASVTGYWFSRWRRMRTAVRGASRIQIAAPIPVVCSPEAIEPGVFGILRPVLMLPQGIWTRMSPEQFSAILAHELCHVRRRDNLAATIHMVVEALFWFHPLVWFLGARMVDERERACDEEVLRQGSRPEVYAEGILNVCKFYLQTPLPCAAGVSGADLRKRIEAIMTNRIFPALTLPRRALILATAATAVAVPVMIGIWNAPRGMAQSQEKPVFEVASIKRMDPGQRGELGFSMLPGGGIRGRCPVNTLIAFAYDVKDFQLSGGPAWIAADLYDIQAKPQKYEGPEDSTEQQVTERTRQRVRALLADRFQFAARTETKEASVFVLSVAKGGHKLKPDDEHSGGVNMGLGEIRGTGARWGHLLMALSNALRSPIVDETGLSGRFAFQLTYRPEFGATDKFGAPIPAQETADDARLSIFTALEKQLGLKLDSQKRPVRAIAIERIERPSEN